MFVRNIQLPDHSLPTLVYFPMQTANSIDTSNSLLGFYRVFQVVFPSFVDMPRKELKELIELWL